VIARAEQALLAQRGGLLCWVPVCLAIGIGGYFALRFEPGAGVWLAVGVIALLLAVAAYAFGPGFRPVFLGVMLVLAGAGLAKLRSDALAGPVLGYRYYGPIEGRIVAIDRSASDALRLTLDQLVLDRISPGRRPLRARISLYGDQPLAAFQPGDLVILTGHLMPPAGPAEPGGFDFARHAWFQQVGAVGYTRNPVLRLAPPAADDLAVRLFALRMALSRAVQAAIPGEAGGFAAAIMTGDRSGIGQASLDALRASNLAHLLAISGLHMGLLTGFVFAVIRYGLALLPYLALRLPVKQMAAGVALVVGAFYLALSGGNVATERAFVMVAVILVAVLLGRRALTLRAVAMAAIIVLVWQPEALTGPGFQMSFAATFALVAVFRALRDADLHRLPRWMRPALSVFISSVVAGMATAPFAAAHFNLVAHYGLIANLASVPLMGVMIMPAGVLAACLAPIGLDWIGFAVMDWGLRWVLWVAGQVAAVPHAVGHVRAPPPVVLPLLALGVIWLILWQGRARLCGMVAALLAFAIWSQSTRPALLVAGDGALIGVMAAEGRALSKASGGGFVADIWLEKDGAPVPQDQAALRPGLARDEGAVWANLGDWQILHVTGKRALADLVNCRGADILILNQPDNLPRPCMVFDAARLGQTGALAFDLTAAGDLAVTTARGQIGARPWAARGAVEEGMVLRR
jgi:competence protein ComEC